MRTQIPAAPEELTPEWLTQALRRRGTIGAATSVSGVDAQPVSLQGSSSLVVRLAVDYSPAGAGPPSFAAKLPSSHPEVRRDVHAVGAPFREARFYGHMMTADSVPAVPRCFAADYERETGDFVLLLEDLSQWETGSVLRPNPDQVEALLVAMAPLHARYWNAAELESARWATPSNARRAVAVATVLGQTLPSCRAMFPGHLGPLTEEVAELAVADPRVFELLGHGPQTILHGDLHLQDGMFRGAEARAIDWQSCFRGMAMTDVARLLMSSLDAAERRRRTESLVARYCDTLSGAGVEGYGPDRALEDFAVALIHNVMVYVMSMPIVDLASMKSEEQASGVSVLDATYGRLEAALKDHHTLAAVRRRLRDVWWAVPRRGSSATGRSLGNSRDGERPHIS